MTTNELTTTATTNNFAVIGSTPDQLIQGEIIVFRKGRYPCGRNRDGDMTEAELLVLDVLEAWVRFEGDKVVEVIVREGAKPLPLRDTLSHQDEDAWGLDLNSKPRDPWTKTYYVYLIDQKNAQDYSFATSSWGGSTAVKALCRQVAIKQQHSPGARPVIRLDAGFLHSRSYGEVPAPVFTVLRWDEPAAPPPRPPSHAPARPAEQPPARRHGRPRNASNTATLTVELDDEIPF